MLLGEPQRTQGDLNFSFFGIPVRVHPMFWLISLLLGPWECPWDGPSVVAMLVWIAALFFSIFLHEVGHATLMRWYGFQPSITLYGMGGLASYNPAQTYRVRGSETARQILISAAGPGAGFLLAAVVFGVVWIATGAQIGFAWGGRFGVIVTVVPIEPVVMRYFVFWLMCISLIWGIVNLLPVYPLDGGHISRELFLKFNPRDGIRQSLILSMITAAGLAGIVLMRAFQASGGRLSVGMLWVPALFGYLAYSSYATLQAYGRHRPW